MSHTLVCIQLCNTKRSISLPRFIGSAHHEIIRHFIGGCPELVETDLIANPAERYRLKTIPSGSAFVELGIILRNFEKFGVET